MRASIKRLAAISSLALTLPLIAHGASAQPVTPDTPPPGQEQPAPGAGAQPDESCTVQPGTAQGGGTAGNEQSLTGQLSNCNGVLSPPAMPGSDIEVPAPDPDPGTTPVLPPGTVPEQPAR